MLQCFKRWHAGGFLWFAVVGIAHAASCARATFAQHVGVHVVARHAIGGANFLQERERFFFGLDMRETCDEAALLFFDFCDGASVDGSVRIHVCNYTMVERASPFEPGKVVVP